MENNNIQYYDLGSKIYDSNKFKYSLIDIQMENFSNIIKDESLRDAIIMKQDEYKEKYDEEKQKLLHDLSLLENVTENIN